MKALRGASVRTAGLLLALSLICGFLAAAGNAWYAGRDFECFYQAGRIAASGGDPYDQTQYEAATRLVRSRLEHNIAPCGPRFPYPPWTTFAFAGLATLGLPIAATVWMSLFVAATVLGIGWSWQLAGRGHIPWPVVAGLAVLTLPFVLAVTQGQFGALSLAMTAGAGVWLGSRHGLRLGIAIAGLALKPQTNLTSGPVLLALAARNRQWEALGGAGIAFLAALAACLLLRPGWLVAWAVAPSELRGAALVRDTTWDLAVWLGSWTLGIVMIALVLAAVVSLVRGRALAQADLVGLGTAFSLVVAPYAWAHDYMVLTLPWSLTLARANELRPARRLSLKFATVFVVVPLFWTIGGLVRVGRIDPSMSALIPMLTTLLLALGIRWATGSATIRKTPEVT